MTKKKAKRGRKALPPEEKKPPQPTIKINEALLPFVKLLKREYKACRVDAAKLAALTALLQGNELNSEMPEETTPRPVADDDTPTPIEKA